MNETNKSVTPKSSVLNQTIIKLGAISFFADVASEMLYPITPIFLTTVLGASMGSLGLIEGVAEAIAGLLKIYSGSWSDKISKRRPFIIAGYLLGAISKPLIGISTSWGHVLLARGIDRTGKGIRSAPRDALIADSVEPHQRGEAFGWHRSMDTFGAAIGPLLAIMLLDLSAQNLRAIYYWALVPGLISVIIALFLRDKKIEKATLTKWENPFRAWSKTGSSYKKYVLAWTVFALTNSSDVFLLMKVKYSGLSTNTAILLYCTYNLTYALSAPYLGKLSDRIGAKKIIIAGLGVFSLVYLGFAFASKGWHYGTLFFVYGLYMGATEGVGKSLAINLCPPNLKASSVGILGTVTGLSVIFASSIAGVLWDHVGPSWSFIYGSIGAGLASVLLSRITFVSSKE